MNAHDVVALLHLAGFVTGIALYAMLAAMTVRGDTPDGEPPIDGSTRLPLATAVLGLVWNTVALFVYGLQDFGIGQPSPFAVALAFTALGFLPAVVVHATARVRPLRGMARVLIWSAYGLGGIGGVLQALAAARGDAPSSAGLLTLTVGYAAILLLLLFAYAARDRAGWRRSLFVVALAAFAVSALHLRGDAEGTDSWYTALLGHHASLPLVLVILYQDYRFAFVDLFLRRALALVSLVALAVTLHLLVGPPILLAVSGPRGESLLATSVHIGLWVLTALLYPFVRRAVGYLVDRVVLERPDYRALRVRIGQQIESAISSEAVLEFASASLAAALGARRVTWTLDDVITPASHTAVVATWDVTRVRIPTADGPCFAIDVGALLGGRRLLSDDLALLESVGTTIARRIDAVRVADERYARDLREREILQLAAESELRALRAQLNPHFLFNALTTIGYLIQTSPQRALETLYRLTELLRAVLRRSVADFVSVGEELEIVEAYLAIELARFEGRLSVTIDVSDELRAARIPPLLLQPLVENAIKHGISPLRKGGRVTVGARVESVARAGSAAPNKVLCLWVNDTGIGVDAGSNAWRRTGGVGLANIEQRLQRHFADESSVSVRGAPSAGTVVELRLPLRFAQTSAATTESESANPARNVECRPLRGVK